MADILTLEQVREALQDRHIMIVAEKTGLHYQTVYNVRAGRVVPSYHTLKKLSDYLQRKLD